MWDLVFLAITVFLFWISVVYTRRCGPHLRTPWDGKTFSASS